MAKYFGHFIKGIGMGIPTGIKIAEMRWQKKEKERIQKEKDEVMAAASAFNKKIEEFYADKELSKDERLQLDTIYMTQGYNVQALIKGSYEAVVKLDKETEERNLALLKSYREAWGDFDLDLSTIPELYEYYKGQTIGEKSKQIFDAGDRLLKKQYEAKQVKEPTIANYVTGLQYLANLANLPPENWEMARKGVEDKFGLDYSAITQEALGELESEAYNLYDTPEEVIASVKAPAGLTLIPKYDTKTDKYYATFSKETVPKPTPPTPIPFKTLQDIKDSFKKVKTKTEYDKALESYNASKEAKASDWTPPAFEDSLTDLIKEVESAFWADFVNKDGKLKDKTEAELYNKRVQQYLALIEEAKNAGIDVSQFQAFIPYKELYWGRGNPLVTSESW